MVVTPRDEAEHVNVRTSRALQLLQVLAFYTSFLAYGIVLFIYI